MTSPITFGKYMLLERINIGGMAEVFKAKAFGIQGFERILAIKRILPNMAEDEEFINMFIDEARIAVQLAHPNVVSIYELGKFESQYYIAMEYVPGKDLRQVLDGFRKHNETMPIAAAAYVVAKICEGLDYAHHKADNAGKPLNLIHRDVSPQNILLSYEGAVKITDFGIVKAEDRASKTQAGVLKGKFGYMSPEQVRGLEIDRRSDIFAVGILLYEALTGKRLFIGESDFSTLEKVRNAEVVPPSHHNPRVGEALERVVLKALARERDERYQWAMELHDDLQRYLIEDETVFNAKRLGGLLRDAYQSDIDDEMQKMEQYMHLSAPPDQDAQRSAADMHAAPTGDWGDNRAEKTMIFESGFEASRTLDGSVGVPPTVEPPPPAAAVPPEPQAPGPAAASIKRSRQAIVTAAVIFALLLGALGYLLVDSGASTGTLVVTSSPAQNVDVFMDDQLIGRMTPIVRPNVPVGEHTLLARASGFGDKAYRFDLVAGAPAEIKVELERTAGPLGEAELEITSDPPMAAILVGGVPQSATPYMMTVHDVTHPVTLEIVKRDFDTQSVTVAFAPGEHKKSIHVRLVRRSPPSSASAEAAPRKMLIHSKPEGATIVVNGIERGTTPKELSDLDPRQPLVVTLSKEGYRPYRESIKFGDRLSVTSVVKLIPDHHRSRVPGATTAGCGGTGGKISISAVGMTDCSVTVGKTAMGPAPMFQKDCPVGRCPVDVRCASGKHYQTTRLLKKGEEEKVIIKADDWR